MYTIEPEFPFLLLCRSSTDLGLGRAAHLLHSVLSFLALLTGGSLALVEAVSLESVLGLELLCVVEGVVDERKAARSAATKVGLEAEAEDDIGGGLVHASQLVADLLLRDGRSVRVDHVDDHLLAVEQAVGHELARSDGAVALCHACRCELELGEVGPEEVVPETRTKQAVKAVVVADVKRESGRLRKHEAALRKPTLRTEWSGKGDSMFDAQPSMFTSGLSHWRCMRTGLAASASHFSAHCVSTDRRNQSKPTSARSGNDSSIVIFNSFRLRILISVFFLLIDQITDCLIKSLLINSRRSTRLLNLT